MGETIEMINKHSKGDAIMVSDVGQHQMFTHMPNLILHKSNVTSGGLGTMGFYCLQLLVQNGNARQRSGRSYW
jgi:acetolactate synthase-1/2/3 large subunit